MQWSCPQLDSIFPQEEHQVPHITNRDLQVGHPTISASIPQPSPLPPSNNTLQLHILWVALKTRSSFLRETNAVIRVYLRQGSGSRLIHRPGARSPPPATDSFSQTSPLDQFKPLPPEIAQWIQNCITEADTLNLR